MQKERKRERTKVGTRTSETLLGKGNSWKQ